MRGLIGIVICMFLTVQILAQNPSDTKAQYAGGDKALTDYIYKSMQYPEEAQKQRLAGKSLIAFTVNEDGTISNVRVLKSSALLLDNEALRIVKAMPKWIPATENGINKKEMVVLPIIFDLTRKDISY